MMVRKEKSDYAIKSVGRTFAVLEELAKEGELGVSELAKRTGLHKNNVFRALATLITAGYVEQKDGNYSVSYKVLNIAERLKQRMVIIKVTEPIIAELTRKTGETSSVAVLKKENLMFIVQVESPHDLKVTRELFCPYDISEDASGILLSAIESGDEEVKKRGYVVHSDGVIFSMAVPIRDASGGIPGAVSIAIPVVRITEAEPEAKYLSSILEVAEKISSSLGYTGT